ncbi:MAG TPA: glycosyltransferase [Alphaproteobacteria bacterium]
MTDGDERRSLMFFMPHLGGGGAERIFVDYTRAAREAGHDVHLVLLRAEGELLGSVADGVRVTGLGLPRARYAVGPLARLIRAERPGAVISQLGAANAAALLAAALARTSARRIAVQGIALSRDRARTVSRIPLRRRLVTGALYRLADVVVSPSEGVREDLAAWLKLPAARLAVAPNPVDLAAIRAAAKAPAPHPWTEPGAPPLILGAGRLAPQKNFALLIDAFARLRAEREARLVILGEGPLRPALEAQIAALGLGADVRMPGFVDNPFAWFARAAAFALSSDFEAFGCVVAEALACGCPVVSTDCPWGPAEILGEGRFGRLVAPGNAVALAAALATTLDHPPSAQTLLARAAAFEAETAFRRLIAVSGLA